MQYIVSITLTTYLTPGSRSSVLPDKLIVTQLVKKFVFYETLRFITMFTRDRHWSLS